MLEIYPDNHLSFVPSLIVAIATLLAPLALLVVTLRKRAKLARLRAEDLQRGSPPFPPLAPGFALLRGRVECVHSQSRPLYREIVQKGETVMAAPDIEAGLHRWTESERTTHAEPFYVADVRGSRIRVEPSGELELDLREQYFGLFEKTRMVVLELEPGKDVFVVGELVEAHDPEAAPSGYRGAGKALVMRAPGQSAMYVGSKQPHSRFDRALRHQSVLLVVFSIAALVLGVLLVPFAVSTFAGKTVPGEVTDKHIDRDDGRTLYTVDANPPGAQPYPYTAEWYVRTDLDRDDWKRISVGDLVAVRRSPFWPDARIEPHASLSSWFLVGAAAAWLVLVAAFRYRPKPRREKLVNTEHGPLPNALRAYPHAIRDSV